MFAFAVLPVLSSLAWPQIRPVWQFLGFAAFGAAIELSQLVMNVGRLAEWDDWENDLIAIAAVLILVSGLRTWAERQARLEAR